MARKILLADDSVTAQNMGRKILADAGYEVVTVNNGSAALKKIAELKPDLIVLDVYMPGYSGLEVCQRLKEAKETARIPVLLTVGKLEPFKPEECKRVKAEGYIVKPFEASELLSALSKLEDRVVPRAESSKPGRFARAIAAVEEGRGDENAEASDADDGWKSRIGFPSKKKKKQKEEYPDESETYNQVNRDLRTVIDRPSPLREMGPKTEDGRLDVAALAAAAGLPKDVTPEELAALAAAAAQVQAAVDGRDLAIPSVEPGTATQSTGPEAAARADEKSEAKIEAQPEGKTQSNLASGGSDLGATFAQQTSEPATGGNASLSVSESVRDFDVIAAATVASEAAPATMAVATAASAAFMSVNSTHRWTAVPVAVAAQEAAVSLEQEMQKAYAAFATAEANQPGFMTSAAEMATGHASLMPDREEIVRTQRDGAHASSEAVDSALAQLEAVSQAQVMAVPAVTDQEREAREQEARAREALEQEAREQEARVEEARRREAREQEARAEEARQQEARAEEARQKEALEQEARAEEARQQEIREQEARAEEARQQEVREQEARAEEARQQEIREQEARAEEARQHEIREQEARAEEARQQEIREQEARAEEARQQEIREQEARAEEARQQEIREQEARAEEARQQEIREQEARAEEARQQEIREQEARAEEARQQEARDKAARELEAKQAEVAAAEAVIAEAVAVAARVRAESSASNNLELASAEGIAASEVQAQRKEKGGDMAEKENQLAATTAAAWASWRQIRETGDNKSKPAGSSKSNQQDDDDEYPEPTPDKAAMAVAAGAEQRPSTDAPETSADDPEAIANIVDKVLADLRPKIAEEISKKLKKK